MFRDFDIYDTEIRGTAVIIKSAAGNSSLMNLIWSAAMCFYEGGQAMEKPGPMPHYDPKEVETLWKHYPFPISSPTELQALLAPAYDTNAERGWWAARLEENGINWRKALASFWRASEQDFPWHEEVAQYKNHFMQPKVSAYTTQLAYDRGKPPYQGI